jgi:hypothetical protein
VHELLPLARDSIFGRVVTPLLRVPDTVVLEVQVSPHDSQLPGVVSFVIRFVIQPGEGREGACCRGMIRHVQSAQQISFREWAEAETFIQQYVPLHKSERGENMR